MHSTQRCAASHFGVCIGQSLSDPHCSHVCVVVSQTRPAMLRAQSLPSRHSTHSISVVSQTGRCGLLQSLPLVQLGTQLDDAMSQTSPLPQLPFAVHWTQLPALVQYGVIPPHCASLPHCTHVCEVMLQV